MAASQDGRPIVHVLVCYVDKRRGTLLTVPRHMTQAEAICHQRYGAMVIADPEEAALADLWDTYQGDLKGRGKRDNRKWFERE